MPSDEHCTTRNERRIGRILDKLTEIEAQMRRWGGVSVKRIEAGLESYKTDLAARDRVVGKALRAGLFDHPFVRAWLTEKRSLGEYENLRRFRLGLERGVQRPMSNADFYIAFHASGLTSQGRGPEQIRVELRRKLRYSELEPWFDLSKVETQRLLERLRVMKRQSFHEWLKRLRVLD